MLLLNTNLPGNHNYDKPPAWWRELNALKGTALDVDRSPALVRDWRGALIVGGLLACNDDSPLAHRFATRPMNGTRGGKQ